MSREEIYDIVKLIVEHKLEALKLPIEKTIKQLKRELDDHMNLFLCELLALFNVKWPNNSLSITCYVGYIPFFPRSAIDKCFYVSFEDYERILRGAYHEINHFIFFKKWKSMHHSVYSNIEIYEPVHQH